MKKLNTILNTLRSSLGNIQGNDIRHDCRLTVGSPSGLSTKWVQNSFIRFAAVLCLVFVLGVGNAWGASTNASVTISTYASAHSWTNGTRYTSVTIDSHITATATYTSGSNVGKYYSASPGTWRFYQSEGGKLVLTAGSGYKITSFTITFTPDDNGALKYYGSNLTSGTAVSGLYAGTVELVAGSTSGSIGKVLVSQIAVTYVDGSTEATYNLVTDASTLAAGDVLVFGYSTNKVAGFFYNGFMTASSATVSDGVLTTDEALEFTLGGSSGAWTFGNGSNTLRATGSATLTLATSGGTNTWTIAIGGSSTYYVTITNTSFSTSRIYYNTSDPRFKNYTSAQGSIQLYRKTASCSNSVTLAHNSPTNGTVSFSPTGPIETCSETAADRQTTMTITPNAGYTLTAFNYSTGSGTISPSNQSPGAPSTTANSAAAQAITLTFAQNANGTCIANATFSAIVPTAWVWKYNNAAIPNPINLYIGQTAALVATYTPAGNLLLSTEKNYDVVKSDGLTQVSKTYAVTNPTYTFRADAAMEDGTIVLTNHNHTSLTTTVHVHVDPLPKVHFVDIVHGYEFSDVAGTIEDNVLVSNKTTPTHAEYSGTGANDCETDHTRLVGWIESSWADAHPDAKHEDIIGAGTGVFIEANTAINVLTYNGNTYYAVWAKLQ